MKFLEATAIWRRNCAWATAGAWGAGAAAVLTVVAITDEDRNLGGAAIAAVSNGVLLFCLVGGISVLDNLRTSDRTDAAPTVGNNPWLLAAVPAVAAFVALVPLRVGAVAADVSGPWSSAADSIVDVAFRAAVVWVSLGVVGTVMARR